MCDDKALKRLHQEKQGHKVLVVLNLLQKSKRSMEDASLQGKPMNVLWSQTYCWHRLFRSNRGYVVYDYER